MPLFYSFFGVFWRTFVCFSFTRPIFLILGFTSGVFYDKILSDIKAKILRRGSEEAFDHFLLKNHFNCERFPYQTPSRAMRSRDILTDEIINEETAGSMIQLFGNAIELTPEMLDGDYTVFER